MASQITERVVRASNIDFHVLEQGDGPLIRCPHGFPDTASSFRHQMKLLADAGYRVVAPFMRGYAPTGLAADGRYDSGALGVIAALGYKDAILFGHDWGAVAIYPAAAAEPARITKLTTATVPYGSLRNIFYQGSDDELRAGKAQLVPVLLSGRLRGSAVRQDDFKFLEKMWTDRSPSWKFTKDDIEPLKKCFRNPVALAASMRSHAWSS